MNHASLVIIVALVTLYSHPVAAQNNAAASSLAAAKELSAASGRPIFAIAGRKT
jgi:hypothetical protein